MTTTTTDIGNRALQVLGTRSVMTSLAESSNEAVQVSLALAPIQNWCFGLANWNFARATASLSIVKGPPGVNQGAWNNTYPPPPWLYEYALPASFVRAIYMTNNAAAAPAPGWLGEPKRFAIALDTVSAVLQSVLLTNDAACTLVYTSLVSDPTLWPWYFERLVVIALAHSICIALTGDKKLHDEITQMLEQQVNISTQSNMAEGLLIEDNTPEWIEALGIEYPYRRITIQQPTQPRRPSRRAQAIEVGRSDDNNG